MYPSYDQEIKGPILYPDQRIIGGSGYKKGGENQLSSRSDNRNSGTQLSLTIPCYFHLSTKLRNFAACLHSGDKVSASLILILFIHGTFIEFLVFAYFEAI